jgi:pSer/pThr/pTyr-binding forkhead associated (FHA) protein
MNRQSEIVVQLIHIEGPYKGEIQEFKETRISIGRNPSCLMRFPAELTNISRDHAEILREGNRFKLVDHSSNGTLVNGRSVKDVFLKSGDVLTISPNGPKISFLTQAIDHPGPTEGGSQKNIPEVPLFAKEIPRSEEAAQENVLDSIEGQEHILTIQYGPTIRAYKKLPVVIGRDASCELVLEQSGILERHAEIGYRDKYYWVKDLTQQKLVRINGAVLESEWPLRPGDMLEMGPLGPCFKFLGEGRMAEVDKPVEAEDKPGGEEGPPPKAESPKESKGKKASVIGRYFHKRD